MKLKTLVDEDIVNYKETSMFLIFPLCSFKCDHENRAQLCQNLSIANLPTMNIDIDVLIQRYLDNPLTSAIVCGGLEPLDSFPELLELVRTFRIKFNCKDTIVIYTGYNKNEVLEKIIWLMQYENIIVKFGRYVPNNLPHLDSVLGVKLASDNQYAEQIS